MSDHPMSDDVTGARVFRLLLFNALVASVMSSFVWFALSGPSRPRPRSTLLVGSRFQRR